MTIQRTIFIFSCLLLVGIGLFMIWDTFIGVKAGTMDKHKQNASLKKDIANRNTPQMTTDAKYEDLKANFVDWETFKKTFDPSKGSKIERTPIDVEAEIRRLIKKEEAEMQSPEFLKSAMEHPEIKQAIRDYRTWAEKRREDRKELKKLQEKLLWRAESMGAILIFDESGNPIGYEKDVYGNPILRSITSVDEKTPQDPLDQVPTDAHRDNLSTPQTIIENDNRIPSLDTPPNPSTPEQQISDLTIHTGETFIPDLFQESFISQTLDWNADFDDQYLDVIVAPYLSTEEFNEYFPTDASRAQLKVRQEQMQTDIVERVQSFLGEDTGNREEKLSIIQETLSKNWGPDITDGVLEQLR